MDFRAHVWLTAGQKIMRWYLYKEHYYAHIEPGSERDDELREHAGMRESLQASLTWANVLLTTARQITA